MLSDKIEHRYKKIYKEDITDLKFALNLLEPNATPVSTSNTQSVNTTTPSNLSISLDKSSASMNNHHFDKHTRHLVKRFKKKEGLSADSLVDRETWDCIIEAAIEKVSKLSNVNRF